MYSLEEREKAVKLYIQYGLKAEPVSRDGQTGVVRFRWEGGVPFSRVLEICGTIPIPPYLNRESETIDIERYQTLYARFRGSVAAPTAGLHFTENVLSAIRGRGIDTDTVCLHVGAGTFLPVKESEIARHPMHREPFAEPRLGRRCARRRMWIWSMSARNGTPTLRWRSMPWNTGNTWLLKCLPPQPLRSVSASSALPRRRSATVS